MGQDGDETDTESAAELRQRPRRRRDSDPGEAGEETSMMTARKTVIETATEREGEID